MDTLGQGGVLQVVPPAELEKRLQQQAVDKAAAAQQTQQPTMTPLAGYIRGQYEIFRNHRNSVAGWSERLLAALRAFNGQYDTNKLQEIRKHGGSTIYARLIAQKCRAASSLLRDIYLGADRPWGLKPPSDPDVPQEVMQKIDMLISEETRMMMSMGEETSPSDLQTRRQKIVESAVEAAKKKAAKQARTSEDKIEELLREGGFYHAMAEFIVDLPIFPFAVLKGPVVRIIPEVTWPPDGGAPVMKFKPKLTWNRVSPFDVWWTPGVGDIRDADVLEKLRFTRAGLNDLLDLPGYNTAEIRAVLDEYGRGGLYDNWDTTDAERAVQESRENPMWNRSKLISGMEFNGNIQGRMLQEYGMAVQDELRDYHVQIWLIGNHVIKANLSPSARMRHPYFITSFEKVPGTPVGNGLTDLLSDLQEASNAALRSLVNNLAIASGPQVVVNDSRLDPSEDGEEMYPWKRWHVRDDPVGGQSQGTPISFFQPVSNAEQLLKVFQEFSSIADDVSAIPKYVGGQVNGGAGRTASGLAMLMGNAAKILQSVSANIDRDVVEDALMQLQDLILLTDRTGLLTGEEKINVQGVSVAIQRETMRQRQLEMLQATANPIDMKIVGVKGRGTMLRSVAGTIGLPGEQIVPSDDKLEQMEMAEQQHAQSAPIDEAVQKAVARGVEQGTQRIVSELTAGVLAERAKMPEGKPTHIGTLPEQQAQPHASPGMDMAARVASGTKPSQLSSHGMGPTTALTGNQPAGQRMISAGKE